MSTDLFKSDALFSGQISSAEGVNLCLSKLHELRRCDAPERQRSQVRQCLAQVISSPGHKVHPMTLGNFDWYFHYLAQRDGHTGASVADDFSMLHEYLHSSNIDADGDIAYLQRLYTKNPVMAVTATHLYADSESTASDLERPIQQWFGDAMHNIASISRSISSVSSILQERKWSGDTELFSNFVQDVEATLQEFTDGCTNMAVQFAIHAQQEDCAVWSGVTRYALGSRSDSRFAKLERTRSIQEVFNFPIYQQFSNDIAGSSIQGNVGLVPTYLSVLDVEQFLQWFEQYWFTIDQALQSRSLQERNKLDCHFNERPTKEAEARIAMGVKNRKLSNFSTRIDQSRNSSSLAIDIGHVDSSAAIAYATELGLVSQAQDIMMQYSTILGPDGAHILDDPLYSDRFQYPSIANSARLTTNEKMGLIASVISQSAMWTGLLEDGDHFEYHLRPNRLQKEEYRNRFDELVRSWRLAMRG